MAPTRQMTTREQAWYTELHTLGLNAWLGKYHQGPIANDQLNRWAEEGFLRLRWVPFLSEQINPRTGNRIKDIRLECTTFKKYTV